MLLNTLILNSGYDQELIKPFSFIIKKIFHCSAYGCYCICVGFLFGFPVGAKTISQYRQNNKISGNEANSLMAFCNQFSPGYYIGLLLPALSNLSTYKKYGIIALIYSLPLLYGAILLRMRENKFFTDNTNCTIDTQIIQSRKNFLSNALQQVAYSMVTICEYMLFSTLLSSCMIILPISGSARIILQSYFEIGIGMQNLNQLTEIHDISKFLLMILLLFFQGISGNLQIIHFIKEANLSILHFVFHRIIICILGCFLSYLILIR